MASLLRQKYPSAPGLPYPSKLEQYAEDRVAGVHSIRSCQTRGPRQDRVDENIFNSIPLDAVLEIFSHLHPLDLLHLARSSRSLRAILMSRSSIGVWRQSLSTVEGLPFCPSDLTEPQYASLAFDDHCHFCLAQKVHQVFWAVRVRCCTKCLEKQFIPEFIFEQYIPKGHCLHLYRLDGVFPYIFNPRRNNRRAPGRILYYLPAIESYFQELTNISYCETAVMRWITQKSVEQDARIKHARLCETWSPHWVYYRQSSDYNMIFITFLSLFLAFIWKEELAEMFAPSTPVHLS